MKKKLFVLCLLAAIVSLANVSSACVGRTVHLAISGAANERLLAEIASLLIVERTGSTVQIDVYKDSADLYNAVKKGDVNFFFEMPTRAAEMVGKSKDAPYDQIKAAYRTKLNLTWLDLGATKFGPVLTAETLATYPALPKLLNKLSRALENDTFQKLLKTADAGVKPKKIARDFLKGKKLI